jgi:hypothetical protein
MGWTGHVSHMKNMGNAYKGLLRKLESERPHGRTRHR